MTSTVAVTNGTGRQTGRLFAFDRASAVAVSGLAAAYNGLALTCYASSRDGKRILATATATQSAGAASFAFDFDTAAIAGLFPAGVECTRSVRLRAVVTATDAVVFDCAATMAPGARMGVA